MAVPTSVLNALTYRWGEEALSRMTNREDWEPGDAIDADALEQGYKAAMKWVVYRSGPQDEDAPAVIEAVVIFLPSPGTTAASLMEEWVAKYGLMPMPTAMTTKTDRADDDAVRARSYTGADYFEDLDLQSLSRPRRGTY